MPKAAVLLPMTLIGGMAVADPAWLGDGTVIRDADLVRLADYDATAGQALLGAFAEGSAGDLAVLRMALTGPALPADQAAAILPGDWQCRTIKMGGILPIVTYPPFACRIGADGQFEKLTGSQRSKGRIHRDGERLIYLGTGFIAGDTPPAYADLPAEVDPQATPQRLPEVGVVEASGPDAARIMLPSPLVESQFNILSLSR